jgi:hypothetical protein
VTAQAAVVAGQGAPQITFFQIQVVLENGAAVTQVGRQVYQVVIRPAQFVFPEGHDLHDALGASPGQGEAVEQAFHMNDRQYQVGLEPGAGSFAVYQTQKAQTLGLVGNVAVHPRGHVQQPDLGIEGVTEAVSLGHRLHQQRTQLGVDRRALAHCPDSRGGAEQKT